MPAPPPAPAAVLRSRSDVGLLVLAAVLGVPISAAAYGFLALVDKAQGWGFTSLPQGRGVDGMPPGGARAFPGVRHGVGFGGVPPWWPLPLLALAGVLVALTIRHLPGRGGHSPADGFKAGGSRRRPRCPASPSPRWAP